MLAAPSDLQSAEPVKTPTTTYFPSGEVVAHCPLCFTPGPATDPECHYCGAEFDLGAMECATCGAHVSAAASRCSSCHASLI